MMGRHFRTGINSAIGFLARAIGFLAVGGFLYVVAQNIARFSM